MTTSDDGHINETPYAILGSHIPLLDASPGQASHTLNAFVARTNA